MDVSDEPRSAMVVSTCSRGLLCSGGPKGTPNRMPSSSLVSDRRGIPSLCSLQQRRTKVCER